MKLPLNSDTGIPATLRLFSVSIFVRTSFQADSYSVVFRSAFAFRGSVGTCSQSGACSGSQEVAERSGSQRGGLACIPQRPLDNVFSAGLPEQS